MGTIFGFNENTLTEFDNAYWAAQPIPVQQLRGMDPTTSVLYQTAMKLAGQGYFIDVPIMVWQWDPYMTMEARISSGYATYPDALGLQTRKTSVTLSDYPTVPVPTPPAGELIGAIIGFGPYFFPTTLAASSNIPAGTTVTENGHSYLAVYIAQGTPFSSATQQILRWEQTS